MRIRKRTGAGENVDAVPDELIANDIGLRGDHVLRPHGEVLHPDALLYPERVPVYLALLDPGQVGDRLPEGLARNRTVVKATAPHVHVALDDRGPPAELGRRDPGPLAGRAAADHYEVVLVRHDCPLTPTAAERRIAPDRTSPPPPRRDAAVRARLTSVIHAIAVYRTAPARPKPHGRW